MTWFGFLVPLLIALCLVLLPGLLVTAPLRIPLLARFAAAGPVTIGIVSLAGILAEPLGVPFSIWPVAAVTLLVAGALWLFLRIPANRAARTTPAAWGCRATSLRERARAHLPAVAA